METTHTLRDLLRDSERKVEELQRANSNLEQLNKFLVTDIGAARAERDDAILKREAIENNLSVAEEQVMKLFNMTHQLREEVQKEDEEVRRMRTNLQKAQLPVEMHQRDHRGASPELLRTGSNTQATFRYR
jgi:chromosome segregation ATPase